MFKFFNKNKAENLEDEKKSLAKNIETGSKKISQFFVSGISSIKTEISVIKEKFQNLHQTNIDLANYHLEKGNISEAIFRFRIIKKFWPNDYESYYQLAYYLALEGKLRKSRRVLEELLEKNPDYDPIAQDLLDHLNKALGDI